MLSCSVAVATTTPTMQARNPIPSRVRQDITDIAAFNHSQSEERSVATHQVSVVGDSLLSQLYKGADTLSVNSFHHQAVCETGDRFRVTAISTDGIIEAMESTEFKPIIGVQWHPECLAEGLPLFQWLVGEAVRYRQTCLMHQQVLTLDSHCDTPMFFPQGVDFGTRDERLLVDLHKMTEGHQDATIMVAYIPQPTESGMKAMADGIFDKIESIVAAHQQYIRIARTPDELFANKQAGRKSIMLGIENGAAIEGSIVNLRHFAQRGIVYMTLCHNGDNDICHAAEKSFYDALEISQQPIVCSHSSCRALCDHPRNLTDQQMRDLAAKGGVMQVTLYHGFLRLDGEATINDVMAHLDHAIEVMGIDHVGLGTDFDGDGGVRGLANAANAAELLHFTRRLMDKGYSVNDIQKIWGGNFLRVMSQVQSVRN